MKNITFLSILFCSLLISFSSFSQASKKVLDHTVYEKWNNLTQQQISNDGNWISYEINPQKGDGHLHIYNTASKFEKSFPRGYRAEFSSQSDFIVFKIKAQYDTLRTLKLDGVKESKLPKDTLAVYLFSADSLIYIEDLKSFSISEEGNNWIVYQTNKQKRAYRPLTGPVKTSWFDFLKKKEEPKAKPERKSKFTYVYNPLSGKEFEYYNITNTEFSYNGSQLAILKETKDDSLNYAKIYLFNPLTLDSTTLLSKRGTFGKFAFDREGKQLAFSFSQDTAKKSKVYELFYISLDNKDIKLAANSNTKGMIKGYSPTLFASLSFSRDGKKVFFGTAPTPKQDPKDTLLDTEKYSVDVWNYQDGQLQTQQINRLPFAKRMSYRAIYHVNTEYIVQAEDTVMKGLRTINRGNGNHALITSQKPYEREMSWDGWYFDYYLLNLISNERELVLERASSTVSMSPNAKYIIYYNAKDSSWYSINNGTRIHTNLTKNLSVSFANEDHDTPSLPGNYGYLGWSKSGKHFFVSDRYDIWKLDAEGKEAPKNLTKNFGRISKIRLSVQWVNYDQQYFDEFDFIYLKGFNEATKQSGYYSYKFSVQEGPIPLLISDHYYHSLEKAKNNDRIIWKRMSFKDFPELYTTDASFGNLRQLTQTNPQQLDYNWGTVELTKWKAYDGTELSGLIYKPENFDSTKKYPMIVYFYERYSDNIHYHYIPKPSHSTINFSEYVSNGYIVFVPDIVYKTGHPAASAYNCIMSGTKHMMKNNWVDSTKMGLQGQSWGGYQTAMLITQTNLFAAAEAGAPVSNMTSAYGGIRWGTGMSRAFQYEKGQSRIGGDLWTNQDLYIQNSPIFFADKVETPLLIMHNDGDGAVPWYQGIEYFSALRRLDKVVWMLTYNNDGHNLRKWPNRVDLSIRMMQFFDHYLKGEPMPIWMAKGIPATKKGKMTGYQLTK